MSTRSVLLVLFTGVFLVTGSGTKAHPAAQKPDVHGWTTSAGQQDSFGKSSSDGVPGAYPASSPHYQVRALDDVVLHDPLLNKDLHIKIFYPEGPGPFPVILFSHGYGGSKDSYSFLTRYWAKHGYVTLQPNHEDAHALRKLWLGGRRLRPEMMKTLNDPAAWDHRVGDLVFLLNAFSDLQRRVPELSGKLDTQRVGVGGHSFGAFTAMLIAGVTVDVPAGPRNKSYADSRPRAFLLLSPQGSGSRGLTSRSWEKVTRPMMVMTGSRDRRAEGEGPAWREDPFRLSPAGNKFLVFITGANHLTFAGLPTPMFRSRKMIAAIQTASLAFWDAYLKGDAKAKAWLASRSLPQICPAAKLERR